MDQLVNIRLRHMPEEIVGVRELKRIPSWDIVGWYHSHKIQFFSEYRQRIIPNDYPGNN